MNTPNPVKANAPAPVPTGEERPPAKVSSRFAGFHAQTYEMELLVSGALAFALLQLPRRIDAVFQRLMTYVDGDLRLLVVYAMVYVSLAVTALIVFFLAHLLLRAYWIGLVGLESVYPGGTDWERIKIGRHSRETLERRLPPLATSIEKLDDICSLVFSVAFSIVLTFVYSILALSACLGVAWLGTLISPWPFDGLFWASFATLMGGLTLVGLADRFLSQRLVSGSRADRVLGVLVRATMGVSPLRLMGPISLVLQSRLSEKRTNILVVGSVLALTLVFMASAFVRQGLVGFGSLVYFPEEAGTEGVASKSYRSNWGQDDFEVASWRPSIDSDVVRGPFVRLFLPYRPRTHNQRMALACPELGPVRSEGLTVGQPEDAARPAVVRAGIECFVGLFEIRLDGEPLEAPRFDWYTEPTHGVPGAVAYLDVRRFAPGRHVFEINAPRGGAPEDGETDERRDVVIPFWR